MGNSTFSFSSAHSHCSSAPDHLHEITNRVASRPRADELCKPLLLKPCIHYNNNDQPKSKLHISSQEYSTAAGDKLKIIKKVRFSDELILNSSSHRKNDPLLGTHVYEEKIKGVLHGRKILGSIFIDPSALLINQGSMNITENSNIARVKLVISKKELNELLLNTKQMNVVPLVLPPKLPTLSSLRPLFSHQSSQH